MFNKDTAEIFKLNKFVLDMNLKDITQADSLVSPQTGGNCINWILGHILVNRDVLREIVGLNTACSPEMTELYDRGTRNINSGNAMDVTAILAMLEEGQNELITKLTERDLSANEESRKLALTLAFHESYHAGQTGLLRRIAGKEGAIK